jgi:hypothetical protein
MMGTKRLQLYHLDEPTTYLDINTVRITKALAVLVTIFLGFKPVGGIAETLNQKQIAIKQQLQKIPVGKAIEVRLLQKEKPKIKGKLLAVGEESLKVRISRSGKFSDEEIAFSNVESVKKPGIRRIYKILIAAGAAGTVAAIASTRGSRST